MKKAAGGDAVEAGDEGATAVKKTKLLLGLKDEVVKLKLALVEEQKEREKVSEWIKTTLRPSLQRMNTNVSSKFEELEAAVAQETATRSKINEWLKVKVGPELEEVEALVVRKLLVEREQWEREKRDEQKEELAQLERTWARKFEEERERMRDSLAAAVSSITAAAATNSTKTSVPAGLTREEVEDIVRRKVADVRYEALQEALKREEEVKRSVEERWRKDLLLKDEEWRRRQDEWERRVEDERRRWQEMTAALLHQQIQTSSAHFASPPTTVPSTVPTSAKSDKNEVAEWLSSLGLERYADQFTANGYDSLVAIHHLEASDLDVIGVNLAGHRKILLSAASKLGARQASPVAGSANGTASPSRAAKASDAAKKDNLFGSDDGNSPARAQTTGASSGDRKSVDLSARPTEGKATSAAATKAEDSGSGFSLLSPFKSLLGISEEEERAKEAERKRREEEAARARGRGGRRGGRGGRATATVTPSSRKVDDSQSASSSEADAEAELQRKRDLEAKEKAEREEKERWMAEDKARDERERREREERERIEREERERREREAREEQERREREERRAKEESEARERAEREERERRERQAREEREAREREEREKEEEARRFRERERREREEREREERKNKEREENERREREARERREREQKEQEERERKEREYRERYEREKKEQREREEREERAKREREEKAKEEREKREREEREAREREEREYQLLKAQFEEEERKRSASKESVASDKEHSEETQQSAPNTSPAGRGRGRGRGPLPQVRGRGRGGQPSQGRSTHDEHKQQPQQQPEAKLKEERERQQAREQREAEERKEAERKRRLKQEEEERKRSEREENERRQQRAQQRKEQEERERKKQEEAEEAKLKAQQEQAKQQTKRDSVGKLNQQRFSFLFSETESPDELFADDASSKAPEEAKSAPEKGSSKSSRQPRPVEPAPAKPTEQTSPVANRNTQGKLSQERFSFLNSSGPADGQDDDATSSASVKGILKERPRSQPGGKRVSFYEDDENAEEDDAGAAAAEAEKRKREEDEQRERERREKHEKEAKEKERRDKMREERVAKAGGEKKGGSLRINNDKCHACSKTVYFSERLSAEGVIFHNACFRCNHCNGKLKLGSYASLEGKYFCKPHFKQLFKAKGNYSEGFGKEKPTAKWLARSTSEKSFDRGALAGKDSDDENDTAEQTKQPEPAVVKSTPAPAKPPGASRPPVKKSVLARYAHVTGGGEDGGAGQEAAAADPPKAAVSGGPSDYSVDEEVSKLCDIAERLVGGPRGIFKFKDIFYDDEAESAFESLVGTLLAARKRKILVFDSPMLLQGVHDDLDIVFTGRP